MVSTFLTPKKIHGAFFYLENRFFETEALLSFITLKGPPIIT